MGIDSHGNNGHSHSHTSCFPFLPIPIHNFVTNSHSHGNPMGFPFPLGIPLPWSSLIRSYRRRSQLRCKPIHRYVFQTLRPKAQTYFRYRLRFGPKIPLYFWWHARVWWMFLATFGLFSVSAESKICALNRPLVEIFTAPVVDFAVRYTNKTAVPHDKIPSFSLLSML